MYLLIFFFPLLGFLIAIAFGRFFGNSIIRVISPLLIFLSLIIAIFCFFEVAIRGYFCTVFLFNWVNFGMVDFKIEFFFDSLTISMAVVILLISFFVHLYSIEYMAEDPHLIRFLGYLSVFTLFMLVFITSTNFIQLFFGWEGIGVSSYLLINFWYTRVEANRSAIKAIIINKFGDAALYVSIILIFFLFKSLNFFSIFALSNYIYSLDSYVYLVNYQLYVFSIISFFLMVASIAKSAQLGLHT